MSGSGPDTRSVAIVTGGASGLGAVICERLAADGTAVVVADVDDAGAWSVVRGITDGGGTAEAVSVDVTDPAGVDDAIALAVGMGPVRTLVLSAAVETRASVVHCTDDEWRRVIDTDLKGPFLCMRATVPPMVDAGGGSIVALGSTLGQIAGKGYAAYCTAKFALTNLCKQVAVEHAADGIRVNVVAPSACDTGLFMRVSGSTPDPEQLRRQVASAVPMGRLGTGADVASTVAFLASDASAYLSGAVIPVDGGLAARRV